MKFTIGRLMVAIAVAAVIINEVVVYGSVAGPFRALFTLIPIITCIVVYRCASEFPLPR
jgi:hypothetical protein